MVFSRQPGKAGYINRRKRDNTNSSGDVKRLATKNSLNSGARRKSRWTPAQQTAGVTAGTSRGGDGRGGEKVQSAIPGQWKIALSRFPDWVAARAFPLPEIAAGGRSPVGKKAAHWSPMVFLPISSLLFWRVSCFQAAQTLF